jgi:adenylate kinase family enzyme
MKIFIVGLPQSGRTTVAKSLAQEEGRKYIDASSWLRCTFREPNPGEHPQQYQDEYYQYLTQRMKVNPDFVVNNIQDMIKVHNKDGKFNFVIDGISSPRDLVTLFNYNTDYVIFLNRTDNNSEHKDQENIGVSVMRDYCFWMSSAGLLPKERWLEYNFKIPGEDSDFVKTLGSKNSVFIVKSIERVISHLKEKLFDEAQARIDHGIFS